MQLHFCSCRKNAYLTGGIKHQIMINTADDKQIQFRSSVHYHFASFFEDKPLAPFAYLVSKKLADGHICLSLDQLSDEVENIHDPEWKAILENYSGFPKSRFVADGEAADQPFVLQENRLYFQRYFLYEKQIAEKINQLACTPANELANRKNQLQQKKPLIEQLFGKDNLPQGLTAEVKIHWQLLACLTAYLHNFSIITGGPGTGKTTTVAKLLALLYDAEKPPRVLLAAPTGKAAIRLSESLGAADIEASAEVKDWLGRIGATTIHRLLKTQRGSINFQHNAENPLPADVIIIDESSMIDVALFAKLLDAVPPTARLILLGDKDQLASVEAGSLFGDLCQLGEKTPGDLVNRFPKWTDFNYNCFIREAERQLPDDKFFSESAHPLAGHLVELQFSWRSQSQPMIGEFAKWVINGNEKAVEEFIEAGSHPQLFVDTAYSEERFAEFLKGYLTYLDESLEGYSEENIVEALQRFNSQKILCAVREGKYGLHQVNKNVENWLKKNCSQFKTSGDFYEHQPVMVTVNNKTLDLSNGDIGLIRKNANGQLKAYFLNTTKKVPQTDGGSQLGLNEVSLSQLGQVETAFAMTIHKSQGSEYDKVLVLLPDSEKNDLLTRELLYTAVTRAKKEVLIQASKEVVLSTTKNKVQRVSGIAARFQSSIH